MSLASQKGRSDKPLGIILSLNHKKKIARRRACCPLASQSSAFPSPLLLVPWNRCYRWHRRPTRDHCMLYLSTWNFFHYFKKTCGRLSPKSRARGTTEGEDLTDKETRISTHTILYSRLKCCPQSFSQFCAISTRIAVSLSGWDICAEWALSISLTIHWTPVP